MAELDLSHLSDEEFSKFKPDDLKKIANSKSYKTEDDVLGDLSPDALRIIAGKDAPLAKETNAMDESNLMSKGEALKIGLEKGMTFNLRPAIGGLAGGLGAMVGTPGGLKEKLSSFGPAYQESRKELLGQQEKMESDRPGYGFAGEMGGALATLPLTAGAKGLDAMMRLGGAYGLGDAISKDQGLKEGAQTVVENAAGAGLAHGVLSGAIPKVIGNKIASGSKSALTAAFGVSGENIDRYLLRPDAIRGAKSVEEIKNLMDKTVQGLFNDVEKSKISQDEAKQALRSVEDQIKTTAQESGFQFKINQADLRDSLKSTSSKLESAFGAEKEKLSSIKSPISMADDVSTAIQDLKKKVIDGSNESYSILDQDPNAYSVRGGAKNLRQMADEMNIQPFEEKGIQLAGKVAEGSPITAQTAGVQNELRAFAQRLENTPQRIPAKEVKKILQQIDASESAMYGQPGFDGRVSQAYKEVRATIDKAIKNANPEYAAKMEEVAGNTGLLSKAIDRFGDPRSTISRLNSISSRTAGEDRKLLEMLGGATERDFVSPVKQFSSAQETLSNPKAMEGIRSSIPESQISARQEAQLAQMSRPEARSEFVQGEINRSGLPQKKEIADKGLAEAVQALKNSTERLEPYKSLGPFSTQNAVKGLMKSAGKESFELRKTIESLSKMSGEDFVNAIADRKTADAFNGEFRAGSRNVNLWSIFGAIAGTATGGFTGGGVGAATGATIGALTDKFGPKMAQKTLDAVLKIKGSPTTRAITEMQLPENVKAYLTRTLIQAENRGESKSTLDRRKAELDNAQ